jgi:hypothetical protein
MVEAADVDRISLIDLWVVSLGGQSSLSKLFGLVSSAVPSSRIWDLGYYKPPTALPKVSAWTASPLQIITLIPRTIKKSV